jgi:manganese oxidase
VGTDGGDIPDSAQRPEVTTLVPVGGTRTIEFIADNPGDWVLHCHMTHHVMNQMGHGVPNMIGVKPGDLDQNLRKLLPGYMTMGQNGSADMGDMGMAVPPNSIPMVGGKGPHDYITMGGMFTILKVRENLTGYDDPGWYQAPDGTQADLASANDLRRDGISAGGPAAATPTTAPATIYTCPMHPEVIAPQPGRCPKCGMNLVPK